MPYRDAEPPPEPRDAIICTHTNPRYTVRPVFERGRVHGLVDGSWGKPIAECLSGRDRAYFRALTSTGRELGNHSIRGYYPRESLSRIDQVRAWFGQQMSPVWRIERCLASGDICALERPFVGVADDEKPRVTAAIAAAKARGATVIVFDDLRVLLDIEHIELLHRFDRDDRYVRGTVEELLRPASGRAIDIERTNGVYALVEDFDGTPVPFRPSYTEVNYTVKRGDGSVDGFSKQQLSMGFYVPPQHVLVEPAFVAGQPSGSPARDIGDNPDDPTARWVVLTGEVKDRYPVAGLDRLHIRRGAWDFWADIARDRVATIGSEVRFGFDTAHIVQ